MINHNIIIVSRVLSLRGRQAISTAAERSIARCKMQFFSFHEVHIFYRLSIGCYYSFIIISSFPGINSFKIPNNIFFSWPTRRLRFAFSQAWRRTSREETSNCKGWILSRKGGGRRSADRGKRRSERERRGSNMIVVSATVSPVITSALEQRHQRPYMGVWVFEV